MHESILVSVTNEHIGVDLSKGLAWAYTNRENYGEFMPLLYSNVKRKTSPNCGRL